MSERSKGRGAGTRDSEPRPRRREAAARAGDRAGGGVHALRAGRKAAAGARLSQSAGDRARADAAAHRPLVPPPLGRRALLRYGRDRSRHADHRARAGLLRARGPLALGADRLCPRGARCLGAAHRLARAAAGLLRALQYLRARPRRARACAGSRCCSPTCSPRR